MRRAAGRLLSVAHRDRASESLRYDAAGRRSSRVREDGATDFFRYDPAGQVTAAAYGLAASADPVAFPATQTFAYDPAGNRTQAVDGPLTASYQANTVNQYSRVVAGAAETVPSFDALGNLLEDDRAAYAWDADTHLLSVVPKDGGPAAAYRYDALHRRVARLEGTAALTYFVHDGWNVVAEYAGAPGAAALAHEVRHVWGEDLGGGLQTAGGVGGLLASVRPSGANWMHYDGNGNVVLLTAAAGTASARYAYDAFGRLLSSSGPAAEANRYRFSTKPQERAAALSYYGYRYYDSGHGRWLYRDPLEEEGGVNLYGMIRNDAINFIDSLGLEAYVYYKDRSFTRTKNTAADLVRALSESKPGSITELNIYGHAGPNEQTLDSDNNNSSETLEKRDYQSMPLNPCGNPKGPVVITGPSLKGLLNNAFNPDAIVNNASGNPAGYDLDALLHGKLAANAEINVNGCHAGKCKEASDGISIARAISQSAPDATVTASTFYTSRMHVPFGIKGYLTKGWQKFHVSVPGLGVTFKAGNQK